MVEGMLQFSRASVQIWRLGGLSKMSEAETIAKRLAFEFLREGRYFASSGPVELKIPGAVAAGTVEAFEDFTQQVEYGGLAVQAVGYEEGTENPKVHVYLTHGSARNIKALPKDIGGTAIAVHRVGAISVRPDAAGKATNRGHVFERNGRICCGSSSGPTSEASVGTLGAIVRRATDQKLYLLSNNHVFAGCNHVPLDQPILSPGSQDGRPGLRAPQEVGRHSAIHELRSGDPHFVNPCDADLAIAVLTDDHAVTSWQGDATDGYDTPSIVSEPVSSMTVKKFGRTTGLSSGIVEAKVPTPMPVNYVAKHFKGVVWFKDVWTVRSSTADPFALPGDSGSLVVTEDGSKAIGLVFAANSSGEYAWIVPMPCAVGGFGGLQLVDGHGV